MMQVGRGHKCRIEDDGVELGVECDRASLKSNGSGGGEGNLTLGHQCL